MYYPVVMCGGSGSRLWPLSRAAYPKQFLPLASDKPMLVETLARLGAGAAEPLLLANEEHRFLVAAQAQAAGYLHPRIVLEPEGRNTAPALALAALQIARDDPQGVMVVLAADHVMSRPESFHDALAKAVAVAGEGWLVTFGITPTSPDSGYGYIERGAALSDGVERVARFTEKPDADTAKAMLAAGGYLWNSGMFAFRVDRYLEELERHAPDILNACRAACAGVEEDMDFIRPDRAAFLECRSESVDYAIMEKTDRAVVVPCDPGWSDIGGWGRILDVAARDEDGNAATGDVMFEQASDCYVRSDGALTALVGVSGLTVVSTRDAVLVASHDRAEEVKAIVGRLKAEDRPEWREHTRVYRPWGHYESINLGPRHQVKHICVTPGAKLSLQKHFHRAEHWVVVAGTALVTRDDEEILLTENESVYLPLGCIHRLENPGKLPLSIIEVQTGTYFGEDDIVRFEDVYDRA